MPSCCGSTGSCACVIQAGPGMTVSGVGSIDSPYVLTPDGAAGLDHGVISSGSVAVDSAYGLHEMVLAGATTITPSGPIGVDMAVRVSGTGVITLGAGAQWDSNPVVLPGTFLFTHWPTSGWRAVAVAPIAATGVNTTAPTFTDATNTLTIPSVTGVIYSVDGVPIAAGAHPGYPEGDIIVIAYAAPGYAINVGQTTSWTHHFPAPAASPTDPFAIGSVGVYYNVSTAGSLVGSGLAMTLDDQGAGDYDMDQSGATVAVTTTTVNSKTALLFDASTKSMRHLSFPSGDGTNRVDITYWMVVKMINAVSDAGLGFEIGNGHGGVTNDLRHPIHPAATYAEYTSAYNTTTPIIVGFTKPPTGTTCTLWVGNNAPVTASFSDAAQSHLFLAGTSAQFAFCAGGTFSKVLTSGEWAGLRAWAVTQWAVS